MKDGQPTIYWAYRMWWGVLHLSILVLITVGIFTWALTDGQGMRALGAWLGWIEDLRRGLSGLIPYPWG